MPLTLQLVTGPTSEPVHLDKLKSHLRVEGADNDDDLGEYLQAARDDVEQYLRRQMMTATYRLYLDDWPDSRDAIRLPRPPAQSVTSIQYVDGDGATQTLATSVYQTDLVSEPARVCLVDGQSWPSLKAGQLNAVSITYVAGWTSALLVPGAIRHAIKLHAGDLYEHREGRLDMGGGVQRVEDNPTLCRLLWKHRILDMP